MASKRHNIYDLSTPPLRATIRAHTDAINRFAFGIAPRTVEAWGLGIPLINGKRQPKTCDVWAAVLARMPGADHADILGQMPDDMADAVRDALPGALAFLADRHGIAA